MTGVAQILWTSDEAARATGGQCARPWQATGVSIDSRTVAPGDLFVAIKGDHFDGHDFVAQALEKGAAAAMVSHVPDGVDPDKLLRVADVLEGLRALGRAARARTRARIVAVTGSVGKTSVKEALKFCLAEQGATHAAVGSFNNHFGLPLTLARMPADCDYAVFEIGMNHAGEIEPLTKLARPHVAVITTIEAVHIENFADMNGIADAKAEIFLGLEPGGVAVLNADNPYYERLRLRARQAGVDRIVRFGATDGAEARALAVDFDDAGTAVKALLHGRSLDYRVGVRHVSWGLNSLAVLGAVDALGADGPRAARRLADLTPYAGRGTQERLTDHGWDVTIINETYNASPVSVRAALRTLAQQEKGRGRFLALLGDMLELGPQSPEFHRGLAQDILDAGIDAAFLAGPMMKHLYDALPVAVRGGWAADSAALAPLVAQALRPHDIVLIKGSRGMKMERVIDPLRDRVRASSPRVPQD